MLDLRDLPRPIVGAPMAGGPSTPALAAAVSDAGGLGFLAGGYRTPDDFAADIAATRERTSAPFGVNLFVVEPFTPDPAALDAYARSLAPLADRLGVTLGEPRWDDDALPAKLALMLDARPAVVSFTFGCPDAAALHRLTQAGIATVVTVTTAAEAREAAARGAGALAVQGPDAGGHRGTWDALADPDTTPLATLVAEVAASGVPVIAAGGLHDPAGVRAVLDAGASAAQVGTALLLADEAGTNATHRAALADPRFTATTATRAWTGRWARTLANAFAAEHTDAPAAYPHLHHLTGPLRRAAIAAGDADTAHLWAGTGHAHARAGSAADLVAALTP